MRKLRNGKVYDTDVPLRRRTRRSRLSTVETGRDRGPARDLNPPEVPPENPPPQEEDLPADELGVPVDMEIPALEQLPPPQPAQDPIFAGLLRAVEDLASPEQVFQCLELLGDQSRDHSILLLLKLSNLIPNPGDYVLGYRMRCPEGDTEDNKEVMLEIEVS